MSLVFYCFVFSNLKIGHLDYINYLYPFSCVFFFFSHERVTCNSGYQRSHVSFVC